MKKNILIALIGLVMASTILLGFQSGNETTNTDYIIVIDEAPKLLEEGVKRNLGDGYKCIGGVSMYKDFRDRTYFMQAMVR